MPGAPPHLNGASPRRRPAMILALAIRWCILGPTNSACRMWPKISCRSTSRRSRWSRNASPENKVRRIEIVIMPGTTAFPYEALIIEDVGGGGGGPTPPAGGGDDGDGGGADRNRRRRRSPSRQRYSTAIAIGIVSIFIFFM